MSTRANPSAGLGGEADIRRCHGCGERMLVDEHTRAGEVVVATRFVCLACGTSALILSSVGHGFLLGSGLFSVVAAGYFFVSKEANAWVVGIFSLGLAAFFGFLSWLRLRDARRNPRWR